MRDELEQEVAVLEAHSPAVVEVVVDLVMAVDCNLLLVVLGSLGFEICTKAVLFQRLQHRDIVARTPDMFEDKAQSRR